MSKHSFWSVNVWGDVIIDPKCMKQTSKTSLSVSFVSNFMDQTNKWKSHSKTKLTNRKHICWPNCLVKRQIRECCCYFDTFEDYTLIYELFELICRHKFCEIVRKTYENNFYATFSLFS